MWVKRIKLGLIVALLMAGVGFPTSRGAGAMQAEESIPAFPGAQGFGSQTAGGRGGRILYVTNLDDHGEGSFRNALEHEKGPRIIVFKVGGVIRLSKKILVKHPYVTVLAQTAPGRGVVLQGAGVTIGTHDVIIRGLRIRPGDGDSDEPSTIRDSLSVSSSYTDSEVFNIILDHNSFSWALDEGTSAWTKEGHDITFSWNIISENLNCSIHIDENGKSDCHSMGMLLGSPGGKSTVRDVSVHHNLFAHNFDRNPLARGERVEITNNVIYNWGSGPIKLGNQGGKDYTQQFNVMGNYIQSGPDTRIDHPKSSPIWVEKNVRKDSQVYVKDNYSQFHADMEEGSDWDAVWCEKDCYRVDEPAFEPRVSVDHPQEAYEQVLESVGARSPQLDPIDTYIIQDVKDGTGSIVDCIVECGKEDQQVRYEDPWSLYPEAHTLHDLDGDGMPDLWEKYYGLNPRSAADAYELSADGYMWIEVYANSLLPGPKPGCRSLTTGVRGLSLRECPPVKPEL